MRHQAKPRHEAGALCLRYEARLQGCNDRLVVALWKRPTSLRPYKTERRGSQGELCDYLVVRSFNNGHGIILARDEVKGFQIGTCIAEALLCRLARTSDRSTARAATS